MQVSHVILRYVFKWVSTISLSLSLYIYIVDYIDTPAAKDGQSDNLFVNIGTSKDRVEFASETTPCISPGHKIWSTKLQRTLLPLEHFHAQGVWRCDTEVPEAFDSLLSDQTLARDMAGNGMTSTAVQAACLAAFVSSNVWGQVPESTSSIQPASPTVSSTSEVVIIKPDQQANPTVCSPCQEVVTIMDAKVVQHEGDQEVPRERGIKRKMPEKSDTPLAHKFKAPKFRCRKKTSGILNRMKSSPGPDKKRSSGNKVAKGKHKMVSILQKDSSQCLAGSCFFVYIYIYTWYFFISNNMNI